jgi:hypothetical protein
MFFAFFAVKILLAAERGQVQYPVMARRKKLSPVSARRCAAKTEEMRKLIHSYCGIFKQKPGEKSVVQELLEERRAERDRENREEKELEERKFQRLAALDKKSAI